MICKETIPLNDREDDISLFSCAELSGQLDLLEQVVRAILKQPEFLDIEIDRQEDIHDVVDESFQGG